MAASIRIGLVSKVLAAFQGIPAELVERKRSQNPLLFERLYRDSKGIYRKVRTKEAVNPVPVGGQRYSPQAIFSYLLQHQIPTDMTEARFREEGFDANAFEIIGTQAIERRGEQITQAVVTYQPMRI
jgi:hypothetical protein